jgi:aminoglycoside phosphotransferase (APT) family kinase protein
VAITSPSAYDHLARAGLAAGFAVSGILVMGQVLTGGRIHTTYLATYRVGHRLMHLVHQRINASVFADPVAVMDNVVRVVEHLRAKQVAAGLPDGERRSLRLIPAVDGRPFWVDGDGAYWRTFTFVPRTRSHQIAATPVIARSAAVAYGRFVALLADLPPPRLHETLVGFHDTPARLAALDAAARADPLGRALGARAELDFIGARAATAGRLVDLAGMGRIPERVVHNDTKLNNVLFDQDSDEALCVVDLDTVMPGLSAYDFGDLVRSCVSGGGEDEAGAVGVRLPVFEALVEGYLAGAGAILIEAEVAELVFAARLIALELGARFLADHLTGDTYFPIERPGDNLARCRRQLALVAAMEANAGPMEAIVERCWRARRMP